MIGGSDGSRVTESDRACQATRVGTDSARKHQHCGTARQQVWAGDPMALARTVDLQLVHFPHRASRLASPSLSFFSLVGEGDLIGVCIAQPAGPGR